MAIRKYALGLPEASEDFPWGHRAFRVNKKVFLFLAWDDGAFSLTVKLPQSQSVALMLPFAELTGYGMGKSGWVTARFARREGWRDHLDDVIRPALEAWALQKTRIEASRILAEQGIAAGPCFDAADLARDPHVAAHEMVIAVPRPDGEGEIHVAGNPVKLSHSVAREPERWPSLGAHTHEVLAADLGLTDAEQARLRAEKVIA